MLKSLKRPDTQPAKPKTDRYIDSHCVCESKTLYIIHTAVPCQYLDTEQVSLGWKIPSSCKCLHQPLLVCPSPPSFLPSILCLVMEHSGSSRPSDSCLVTELCSGSSHLSLSSPTPVPLPSLLPALPHWCLPCCHSLQKQLLHEMTAARFWKNMQGCDVNVDSYIVSRRIVMWMPTGIVWSGECDVKVDR